MFTGEDGKVRTVIGLRGDSCVRMSSQNWGRRASARRTVASTWTSRRSSPAPQGSGRVPAG